MALQGRAFTEDEIQRIASLLANTDMTVAEIATRMACSRSAVLAINRKRQVRTYDGLRSTWRILPAEPVGNHR
jgi:ribosomal protein S13